MATATTPQQSAIGVGSWVQRKGDDCGMTGYVVGLEARRDHIDNWKHEYTTAPRLKARVRWHTTGDRHRHSTLLVSSLQLVTPATEEQKRELVERAHAQGYSGVSGLDMLTYARAKRRLDDYRNGRVGKPRWYCRVCNQSHLRDEQAPCRVLPYLLYDACDRYGRPLWSVYETATGQPVTPALPTVAEALTKAQANGIAWGDIFISESERNRAAMYGQAIAAESPASVG